MKIVRTFVWWVGVLDVDVDVVVSWGRMRWGLGRMGEGEEEMEGGREGVYFQSHFLNYQALRTR